ncbi:MAG: tRNA (N(6)-L-threonylcarbamoyladenosine(37)-C(2))-methylthiotransferase MtaB [Candidatus Omnitrophica bacterium]|nr:tRNA (N(6)-L-threonylcarbamoyladenosine(37)-C(2))-methylthiotransferase MtaB [Candidatus Omnitrophota bacterium]
MKSVKFYTLGCKVNQYDTQEIRERFLEAGLREAAGSARADICVVNTCTVTAKADKESLYHIHRAHRENPGAKIVVTGCLVEQDRALVKRQAGVKFIVPNREKAGLAACVLKKRVVSGTGISSFAGHARAFLKVQDGCNNFCSYCKVPLVRGRSRSRLLDEITVEARQLAANGFKEIVLTGICLGAFGRDLRPKRSLVDVIAALETIPGLVRIRLSSIEAGDVSAALIKKMAASEKLCRHLHIPIQSGDDTILNKMHRSYTRSDYLGLIAGIKKHIPGIGLTTDVLVGFPGETGRQFANTVGLIKAIEPLRCHVFGFSPRPGTAAFDLNGALPPAVIRQRAALVRRVAEDCGRRFRTQSLGTREAVLLEGRCQDDPAFWEGYTAAYIKVRVRSRKDLTNSLVRVRLAAACRDYLLGTVLRYG